MSDSPETDEREFYQGQENQKRIVNSGRDPALELLRGDKSVTMRSWAQEILQGSDACAALLDQAKGGNAYRQALALQLVKLENPDLTPSARVLRDMASAQQSFYAHTLALAEQHRAYFATRPLAEKDYAEFAQMSEQSLQAQTELETQQQITFEQLHEMTFSDSKIKKTKPYLIMSM